MTLLEKGRFTIEDSRSGFDETVSALRKKLAYCSQAPDGTIYWYEGTVELLIKVLAYATGENQTMGAKGSNGNRERRVNK